METAEIKTINISDLPADLRALAEQRRGEQKLLYTDKLDCAFKWKDTPEGHGYWSLVNEGKIFTTKNSAFD